jgi:hypothetical protein
MGSEGRNQDKLVQPSNLLDALAEFRKCSLLLIAALLREGESALTAAEYHTERAVRCMAVGKQQTGANIIF